MNPQPALVSPEPDRTGPGSNPIPIFTPPPGGEAFTSARREALGALLDQSLALLHLLGEQGKMVLLRPTPGAGERFLATVHRLTALFDASEDFNALGRLWSAATQARGESLEAVLALASDFQTLLRVWREGFHP